MRADPWIAVAGLVLIASACVVIAVTRKDTAYLKDHDDPTHVVLPAEMNDWRDAPPGLPAGGKFAVISGDPSKPAPFMIRVELPPGYTIPPYRRVNDEHLVVLSEPSRWVPAPRSTRRPVEPAAIARHQPVS